MTFTRKWVEIEINIVNKPNKDQCHVLYKIVISMHTEGTWESNICFMAERYTRDVYGEKERIVWEKNDRNIIYVYIHIYMYLKSWFNFNSDMSLSIEKVTWNIMLEAVWAEQRYTCLKIPQRIYLLKNAKIIII